MKNAISWFEIPATDIERAQKVLRNNFFRLKCSQWILAK